MLAGIVIGFVFWCIYLTAYICFSISLKRHISSFELILSLGVSLFSGAVWGFLLTDSLAF